MKAGLLRLLYYVLFKIGLHWGSKRQCPDAKVLCVRYLIIVEFRNKFQLSMMFLSSMLFQEPAKTNVYLLTKLSACQYRSFFIHKTKFIITAVNMFLFAKNVKQLLIIETILNLNVLIILNSFKHKDFQHQAVIEYESRFTRRKTACLRSLKKIQQAAKIQVQREPLLKISSVIVSIQHDVNLIKHR